MLQTKIEFYNPANYNKENLINNFVDRDKVFESIFEKIKNADMKYPEQHFIIEAQRGSGKTTLLWRIYYEIKRDLEFEKDLIPVMFPEEQYYMDSLYELWNEIISILHLEDGFELLNNEIKEIYNNNKIDEVECEELIFNKLIGHLKKNKKKLLLLMDNFVDFIDKLDECEQHRLRKILTEYTEIRIVSASSRSVEFDYNYKYEAPFFEFFEIVRLKGMSKEDICSMIYKYCLYIGKEDFAKTLEDKKGKLDSLRILSGGIPRTILLLFDMFLEDDTENTFLKMDRLLDNVSHLYKARMEELTAKQQKIIDKVALNWQPINFELLVKKVRLKESVIIKNLGILKRIGILDEIRLSNDRLYYQLKERFFNIWYTMRCRKDKYVSRVKWFIEFLDIWCNRDELSKYTDRYLDRIKDRKVNSQEVILFAESIANSRHSDENIRNKVHNELIIYAERENDIIFKKNIDFIKKKRVEKESKEILEVRYHQGDIEAIRKIGNIHYHEGNMNEAERCFIEAIEKGDITALNNLANLYKNEKKVTEKAKEYYLKAIEKRHVTALNNLAILCSDENEKKDMEKAEEYYLKAIENGYVTALYNLAILYKNEKKDVEKAEEYYLKAIEKIDVVALYNLAILCSNENEKKDIEKAEEYYLKAIENGDVVALNNLVNLYKNEKKDIEKAEEYYLKAIENGRVVALNNLAILYSDENEKKDIEKAEEYYLKAIEKGHVAAIYNLANLYKNEKKDIEKAEEYYLKAIEKGQVDSLNSLAWLYYKEVKDKTKSLVYAKTCFNKRKEPYIQHTLATVLLWNNKFEESNCLIVDFLKEKENLIKFKLDIIYYLLLLLAKDRFEDFISIFKNDNVSKNNFEVHFMPVFNLYRILIGEEVVINDEVKETIEEIKETIIKMKKKYC